MALRRRRRRTVAWLRSVGAVLVALMIVHSSSEARAESGAGSGSESPPGAQGEAAEREPAEPEAVFSVVAVTRDGEMVTIDGGVHDGIIEGMRFQVRRGRETVGEFEVFWVLPSKASGEIIPGSRLERQAERGDTVVIVSDVAEPPAPQQGTRPRDRSEPDPGDGVDSEEVVELRRYVSQLQDEVFRLNHDNQTLRQERDEARGQVLIRESQLDTTSETSRELRRQLDTTAMRLQRDVSFGLGGRFGGTYGTPMFHNFGLGLERFAMEARATVDVFAPGPIDGFRLGVVVQEQPGRGPGGESSTLRTSVVTEVFFPDPFGGLHTGLAFSYAHHHFPDPFLGHRDSGEISISWGKRLPMTQQREAESFWRYAFQPMLEFVHAPYGATGTDLRLGLGFPDLIEVWANFNWHYFTDYGRFGALHVRARVPVIQDHGHLGSVKLILAGDYTYPFDSSLYAHTYSVGLHLEATLGR